MKLATLAAVRRSWDSDAGTYLKAVEAADQQQLEPYVAQLINQFILGCKADGIWSAIKSSCVLMGARTLAGSLTPLVGTAPTNNGPFVAGDYNRRTGLVGNAATKYLNTNYTPANRDDRSFAVYLSAVQTSGFVGGVGACYFGNTDAAATRAARTQAVVVSGTPNQIGTRASNATTNTSAAQNNVVGFVGVSRAAAASYTRRANATTEPVHDSSTTAGDSAFWVFARDVGTSELYTSARISFYAGGDSLTLSLLDSRVTTLYNAIGAAIP